MNRLVMGMSVACVKLKTRKYDAWIKILVTKIQQHVSHWKSIGKHMSHTFTFMKNLKVPKTTR